MLSLSRKSIFCLSQLATSNSRYVAQLHPIIVNYFIHNKVMIVYIRSLMASSIDMMATAITDKC